MMNDLRFLTALVVIPLFSSTLLAGDDLPVRSSVEFVFGDYLASEGGTWEKKSGSLDSPFGIDFDAEGAMWIVELSSGRLLRHRSNQPLDIIRSKHPKGYSGDGGPVSQASFNGPHNVVVHPTIGVLVSDSWNHCIRAIDPKTLTVTTITGNGKAGYAGDGDVAKRARYDFVMCISLSSDRDTVHIADLKNRRVRNLELTTNEVKLVAGNGKKGIPRDNELATDGPLVDPRAVASDHSGNLYVLERGGHSLRRVKSSGEISTVAGTGERGFRDGEALASQFGAPKHICCDPQGNVFVADDLNGAIRKYSPHDQTVTTVLGRGNGDNRLTLSHPHGVRWNDGWLYVVDTGNNRIIRFRP